MTTAPASGASRANAEPHRRNDPPRAPGAVAIALTIALAAAVTPATAASEAGEPPRLSPREVELTGAFDAAPGREVYRAIGEQAGLAITFDPELRDRTVSIDLDGMAPLDALDRLATITGHFLVPVDARSLMVVHDTPQNRRRYEAMGIRSFVLRHAEPGAITTALRSLVDARRITATGDPDRITVRDTYPRLDAAARLVEMLDREPWEIRLRAELLSTDPALLQEIAEAGAEIAIERAAVLRSAGTPLAVGVVGLVGSRQAEWKVFHEGAASGGDEPPREGDRMVTMTARGHLVPGEDHLGIELDLSLAIPREDRLSSFRQTSSFRIAPGTLLALPILLRNQVSEEAGTALVLLLTPTAISRGELGPVPYETIFLGSEANPTIADP